LFHHFGTAGRGQVKWAKEQGIVLMFIQPGKPNQNAFVERFNRSFRDEVLNANLSLGDVAPMEFMPRKFVKEISSFELST
jgi:putative transposase